MDLIYDRFAILLRFVGGWKELNCQISAVRREEAVSKVSKYCCNIIIYVKPNFALIVFTSSSSLFNLSSRYDLRFRSSILEHILSVDSSIFSDNTLVDSSIFEQIFSVDLSIFLGLCRSFPLRCQSSSRHHLSFRLWYLFFQKPYLYSPPLCLS